MYNREYTPERISELKENEIFVFGSNLAGSHGGGAARLAYNRFGAIWGQGVGLQGQSYAIPTMQGGVETIKPYVDEFIRFAKQHPEMKFLVTKIGCGIAAFTIKEIAPLFKDALDVVNIILPKEFVNYLNYWLNDDMANMKFKAVKIKFFDEDMKKMEGMTLEERVEFKAYLKSEHRYTVVRDKPNCSWDSEKDFLEKYRALMAQVKTGDHDAYYKVKELRAKEFRNTVEIVNRGRFVAESGEEYVFPDDSDMMRNTVFYEQEIHLPYRRLGNEPTIVEVQNIDCLYAGVRLQEQGYNPAVLNMASRRNPGGGVTTGAGAQEETLFRRTNLFRSLYQFAPYAEQYGIKPSHHQYPLDRNYGGVYTPNAIYFRESEQKGYSLLEKPVCLSFITVAGMNRPDLIDYGMIADHHVEPIKNKIRTIFRMGMIHSHDSLVLGALGCGAFRNPPRHVARLFHEVMDEPEFKGKYRRVIFAILDDHNAHQKHNPEGNFKPFADEFSESNVNVKRTHYISRLIFKPEDQAILDSLQTPEKQKEFKRKMIEENKIVGYESTTRTQYGDFVTCGKKLVDFIPSQDNIVSDGSHLVLKDLIMSTEDFEIIPEGLFENIEILGDIELPWGLEKIGEKGGLGAFRNSKFSRLHIPSEVSFLGDYAFAKCEIGVLKLYTSALKSEYGRQFKGATIDKLYLPENSLPMSCSEYGVLHSIAVNASVKEVYLDKLVHFNWEDFKQQI